MTNTLNRPTAKCSDQKETEARTGEQLTDILEGGEFYSGLKDVDEVQC